jgi:hypothetical protein
MRPSQALRLAGRDLFFNSWRLVPLNAALGLVLVAGALGALTATPAVVLLVLAGLPAAALMHCAVLLERSENLTARDALDGLRLHWRRGLGLSAAGLAIGILGVLALRTYFTRPSLIPLGFLALYVLCLAALYGLIVWTLAIAEPERPLGAAAGRAARFAAQRPGGTLTLGLALLVVNAAGLAAGVMPFLTVTVAYSFLAVAYFVLPAEES